ncbi:MAG: hypothetical protein ABIO91_08090, partial [Pyrinomonadaceae bacterium]
FDEESKLLTFRKHSGKMIVTDTSDDATDEMPLVKSDAVGAPLPQTQTATGMSKSKGERNEL